MVQETIDTKAYEIKLDDLVEDSRMSSQLRWRFEAIGITNVGQILEKSERDLYRTHSITGIGRKSMAETKYVLAELGYELRKEIMKTAPNIWREKHFDPRRTEKHYQRFYGIFSEPWNLRDILLKVQSEDDWAKPQDFSRLRKRVVYIPDKYLGRDITLHTLLMLYGAYKFNQERNEPKRILLGDFRWYPLEQKTSGRNGLGELLDMAGIDYKWNKNIEEVPFGQPEYMKYLLTQGEYDGHRIDTDEIMKMRSTEFRKVRFYDSDTGFDITGHSMMLFYSAMAYAREHGISLTEAAVNRKMGKSNGTVLKEIKNLI